MPLIQQSGVILGALELPGVKGPNEQHSLGASHGSYIISFNPESAHCCPMNREGPHFSEGKCLRSSA